MQSALVTACLGLLTYSLFVSGKLMMEAMGVQ